MHPQWVVTAAHCVRRKKLRPRNIIIRVGDHDNTLFERSEVEIRVAAKFQHPDFDLETVDSDIALLKLARPVETTPYVQPACLPPAKSELPPGTECFVTGWGKLHATAYSGAEILHQAKVPLIDQRACRKAFEYDITDNMVSAQAGGKIWIRWGIVSPAARCAFSLIFASNSHISLYLLSFLNSCAPGTKAGISTAATGTREAPSCAKWEARKTKDRRCEEITNGEEKRNEAGKTTKADPERSGEETISRGTIPPASERALAGLSSA